MIILKSEQEIERIRAAGRIVKDVLERLKNMVAPGVTTKQLDKIAHDYIFSKNAFPAFLGYRGFPASICTSKNFEVVHGMPNNIPLVNGDIISIDIGVLLNSYYADAAITLPVGNISKEAANIIRIAKKALDESIKQAVSGNRLFDISNKIQTITEKAGYSVVRDFVGHGIGSNMHEEPQIPNFGERGKGPRLKKGMVFCLEPMINVGGYEVEVLADNWTVVTKDRSLSAHFEHTILITEKNPEILTI
ncbi:MAG: type I methionyl aminopeptidase [bacterium]|nr:type I methionyl aminopeptidase [bacterium]